MATAVERFLFGLRARGVRPGLEPTRAALDALGTPDAAFRSLQVAGTVGKGSTSAFAAAILRAAGWPTGLFTSPHLVAFRERFELDGGPVTDAELAEAVDRIRDRVPWAADPAAAAPSPGLRPLTFFEWCTVLACELFARHRVEAAVLEVGLGGRWDATTAAAAQATAITRIGLDHQDMLGTTLTAIAGEKAGVIRPGTPVVSARQAPEALSVLEARARALSAPLWVAGRDFDLRRTGAAWRYEEAEGAVDGLQPGLAGPHQRENAAVAVAAVRRLARRLGRPVSDDAARKGLAEVRWPGRLEQAAPGLWLDGAHNVDGCAALAQAAPEALGGRYVLVFACLADRDPAALLAPLLPGCDGVVLTRAGGERALDPRAYADRVGHARVEVVPEPAEALEEARRLAGGAPVLACGSLYLVGALKAALAGRVPDPGDPLPVPR